MKTALVCGCGHSGTTLVANMLAAHPEIFVPLEETGLFFGRLAFFRLARLKFKAWQAGKTCLVEKTPRHLLMIPRIRRVAKGAKIIILVRDGRDVTASIFKRLGNLPEAVDRWISSNQIAASEQTADDVLILRYEDLVDEPEVQMRRVCGFIGVEFSQDVLNYHEKSTMWFGSKEAKKGLGTDGEEHTSLRNWQVNQPIFDGRGKWKSVFETPPKALEEGPGFELMQHFGYADTAS